MVLKYSSFFPAWISILVNNEMQEYPVLGIFHIASIEKIPSGTCLNSFQTLMYHFIKSRLRTWNSTTSEYL